METLIELTCPPTSDRMIERQGRHRRTTSTGSEEEMVDAYNDHARIWSQISTRNDSGDVLIKQNPLFVSEI